MAIKDRRTFLLLVRETIVSGGVLVKDDEGDDPITSYLHAGYITYLFSRPTAVVIDESMTYSFVSVVTYGGTEVAIPFVEGRATIPLVSTSYVKGVA